MNKHKHTHQHNRSLTARRKTTLDLISPPAPKPQLPTPLTDLETLFQESEVWQKAFGGETTYYDE